MKILHTSDWHLGKKLFRLDRTDEHVLFLDWLINFLKEHEIDVLLIAGDIFDVPTPPHQSLEIFYDFLFRISQETHTHCYIIAGNHDSGILLEAPSKILKHHRVNLWGRLTTRTDEHWKRLTFKEETIDLCAIPFFRSYELLPNGEGNILEALKKYLQRDKVFPQILMLHHLAGKFESAGSEQVITLSGIDSIPSEELSRFDYVALGHIHKPQKIGPNSYYSGSPLPMRFSETQKKIVKILEVKNGNIKISDHFIPQSRDFYLVKTNLNNWKLDLEKLERNSRLMPMVEVHIELDGPVLGLIDEMKAMLKQKGMELLSYIPQFNSREKKSSSRKKIFELGLPEIFEEFYKQKFPALDKVPEDIKTDFMELIQKAKNAPDQIKN